MKDKSEIINDLISEGGYSSYLEIGYGTGANFKSINAKDKTAVDPSGVNNVFKGTSDEFFDTNKKKYDVIFIDGLHHSEQVEKDIINAWYCVKMGGIILLHDVLPFTEAMQIVPRTQDQWTGDVWRAFEGFREKYGEKIDCSILEEKYGLGLIKKVNSPVKEGFINNEMTYDEYRELRG